MDTIPDQRRGKKIVLAASNEIFRIPSQHVAADAARDASRQIRAFLSGRNTLGLCSGDRARRSGQVRAAWAGGPPARSAPEKFVATAPETHIMRVLRRRDAANHHRITCNKSLPTLPLILPMLRHDEFRHTVEELKART